MSVELKRLNTALSIKSVSDQRIISGHCAAWSLDLVGDVIAPTAFNKTLSEKQPSDVAVFIGHKSDEIPVGIPITIRADEHGLYCETKIFEGAAGDSLLGAARGLQEHGQTLGLSIGYRVPPNGAEMVRLNGKTVRKLTSIDLVEYSFAARQTIANPAALMTGVKTTESKSAVGSFDWIEDLVEDALEQRGSCCCCIVELFPDSVVYRQDASMPSGMGDMVKPDDDCQLYRSTYSIVGDMVTLGDPVPVDVQYVPMPAGMGGDKTTADDLMSTSADWSVNRLMELPDSAFLFVEPGDKDANGHTVASKRHFAYRDAKGAITIERLPIVLADLREASIPALDADAKTRLMTRVRAMIEGAQTGRHDPEEFDRPEWKQGAALDLLGLTHRLADAAEQIAVEHKSMTALGMDIKSGNRIRPELRQDFYYLRDELTRILEDSSRIDRGEEALAEVEVAQYRFRMMGV